MKFVITIRDTENGNVRVDANPDFEVLAKMARNPSELTPAAAYAVGALAYIKKESIRQLKVMLEEKSRNGEIPQIYDPETKLFT